MNGDVWIGERDVMSF